MQKVEAFIPIEASREEATTRCRSQQGLRLSQTGALGGACSVIIIHVSWRAVIIPVVREGRIYERCAVKISNPTEQVRGDCLRKCFERFPYWGIRNREYFVKALAE